VQSADSSFLDVVRDSGWAVRNSAMEDVRVMAWRIAVDRSARIFHRFGNFGIPSSRKGIEGPEI